MVLYYNDNDIYLDYQTINERVSIPGTTLYRQLRDHCDGIRYRNRMLFRYKDLIDLPEIFKEIQNDEILK